MFLKNGRASLLGLDLDSRGPLFAGGLWRLLLLLTMLAPELRASTDSSISGTVTDPKGQAISGAAVTVIEVNTNVKQTTATDSKGFLFSDGTGCRPL
jgi:hypothetical protein